MEQQFEQLYEEFSAGKDMIKTFEHIDTGIPRWRIHIFEKHTAPSGGDREMLFAEDPDRDKCLQKAIDLLSTRMRHEKARKAQ